MSKQLYTVSKEGLEYLCGLINKIVTLPSDVISDITLSTNKTMSSVKIDKIIKQCLQDANEYSNEVVNSLTHLVAEKIDFEPTLDNTTDKINTLLLYSSNSDNNYTQYLRLTNELLNLGDTSLSLNEYMKKVDADTKYTLKTTTDTLTTEVTNIKSDFNTHKDDTDIHVTTTDKDKWNKVTDKVDKTNIIDNLTSTNTDKPLSANQGKVLKGEVDKKANDNEVIKKTAITTTINSSSTDSELPTAKAVNELNIRGTLIDQSVIDKYGTEIIKYPLGRWYFGKTSVVKQFSDIPWGEACIIDIMSIYNTGNPWDNIWSYRNYKAQTIANKGIFVRQLESGDTAGVLTADTGWQRVCTTSVADVPFTDITSKLKNCSAGIIGYSVKDGICRVKINGLKPNTQTVEILATGILPTPDPIHNGHFSVMYTTGNMALFIIYNSSTDGVRLHSCNSTIAGDIYCTLEYPVKQS